MAPLPDPRTPLDKMVDEVSQRTVTSRKEYIGKQRALIALEEELLGKSYHEADTLSAPAVNPDIHKGQFIVNAKDPGSLHDAEKALAPEAQKQLAEARRQAAGAAKAFIEETERRALSAAMSAAWHKEEMIKQLADSDDGPALLSEQKTVLKDQAFKRQDYNADITNESLSRDDVQRVLQVYAVKGVYEKVNAEAQQPFAERQRKAADDIVNALGDQYEAVGKMVKQEFDERNKWSERLKARVATDLPPPRSLSAETERAVEAIRDEALARAGKMKLPPVAAQEVAEEVQQRLAPPSMRHFNYEFDLPGPKDRSFIDKLNKQFFPQPKPGAAAEGYHPVLAMDDAAPPDSPPLTPPGRAANRQRGAA